MFGGSITAAVLAAVLLINGSQAKRPSRGPSTHHARHARGSESIDTSNYRFLTNKTKCLLYSIYVHLNSTDQRFFLSSCGTESTQC
jgi:hypothetical protein